MKVSTTEMITGIAVRIPVPRDIKTITVAMAPGPARSGIANGTTATSSFCDPSSSSSGEVFVCEVRPRSMSSEVISKRMPPATRKALSVTAKTLKISPPKRAKKSSRPDPTKLARIATWRPLPGSRAVIATKIGTTPNGSTTKKTAGRATTKLESSSRSTALDLQPKLPHHGQRFEDDPPAQLGLADPPILEDNRDLLDLEALLDRSVGQLDLERIAGAVNRRQIDRLQHASPETLEASGKVALRQAENRPRVKRAGAADQLSYRSPVDRSASGHVARAEHQVRAAFGPVDEDRKVLGMVAEI